MVALASVVAGAAATGIHQQHWEGAACTDCVHATARRTCSLRATTLKPSGSFTASSPWLIHTSWLSAVSVEKRVESRTTAT